MPHPNDLDLVHVTIKGKDTTLEQQHLRGRLLSNVISASLAIELGNIDWPPPFLFCSHSGRRLVVAKLGEASSSVELRASPVRSGLMPTKLSNR